MFERWLPVVGWEWLYAASNLGRVMIIGRVRDDGRYYPARIKSASIQNGYPCVSLYKNKRGKRVYVLPRS